MRVRPRLAESGEIVAILPLSSVERREELAVSIAFMTDRQLFGEVYAQLQPDYFFKMENPSGVFVKPVVLSETIASRHRSPGDIDLLVIPYEGRDLILDRILALEVKIIRARYERQGKSPNDMGMSQAHGLQQMGFPYVGLMHLVVSDDSPEEAWKEFQRVRVLDKRGNAEWASPARIDPMPTNLIRRAIGRLERARKCPSLGLAAAYIPREAFDRGRDKSPFWYPLASPAAWSDQFDPKLAEEIAAYFDANAATFLDNPRFDPD